MEDKSSDDSKINDMLAKKRELRRRKILENAEQRKNKIFGITADIKESETKLLNNEQHSTICSSLPGINTIEDTNGNSFLLF